MAANVEVKIKLNDQASTGLKKIGKEAEAAATKSAKVAEQMASKSSAAVENSVTKSRSAYEKLASARTQLGVRSEKSVQNEIKQTEAAYNRLARSGTVSAKALAQAQTASINKVRELKKELGETEKSFGRINKLALGGAAVGAYAMMKPAVDKAVDYDRTVASMTNTMFADRDTAGRIAGKAEIKGAINDALIVGGGTREQAAGTLNSLMGSGEFTKAQAYKLTGTIQKSTTATGADSSDLASIALGAKRMGIKPEDIDKAISKAIRSGELGGFELKDMAKHLPAVLSSMRALGVTGMDGFERALSSMQSSVLTAGTKDEAANNLINLLEKINSQDTAKDFGKQGINLRKELVAGANRGEDTVTTFTKLIDRVIAKDPKSKATKQELTRLQALAEDKKNPMREQALKQIEAIYASGVIGKFLQDRQALQGFRAESQGDKSGLQKTVREGLKRDDAAQELNTSYAVMDDTASKKLQDLENNKLKGQDEILTGAGGVIKPLFDGMVALSGEYPLMTASVVAAKDALVLMAGAAVLNAALGGGKLAGGVLTKAVGVLGAGLGAGTLSSTLGGAATLSASSAAGVLVAGAVGVGIGTLINKGIDAVDASVGTRIGETIGVAVAVMLAPFSAEARNTLAQNLKTTAPEAAKVETTVKIMPSPDFRVQSQTTKTSGPVKNTIHTGNLREGAMW